MIGVNDLSLKNICANTMGSSNQNTRFNTMGSHNQIISVNTISVNTIGFKVKSTNNIFFIFNKKSRGILVL